MIDILTSIKNFKVKEMPLFSGTFWDSDFFALLPNVFRNIILTTGNLDDFTAINKKIYIWISFLVL